ncbi:hypothetical protein GF348_08665 [candidate division KSB3 bacterium]|nr:hypothetical protein [candidate division KSB3 bacterium]
MPGDEDIPMPGDEEPEVSSPSAPASSVLSMPFEVRGYVENTTTVEYLRTTEEEILLNAGRVRMNFAGEPSPSLDVGIGLVGTFNAGTTDVDLAGYLPDDLPAQILPDASDIFTYRLDEEELFVQEAFGTLYTEHLRLRVGRHKFYTGTGYAYNPIDLFNVKDPLDPTYETDGLDALLLTLNLPRQTELQGMIRYDDHLKTTDYLARLKTYFRGWDLAWQYTHFLKPRLDWEALNTEEALTALLQGRSVEDFSREFRWHLIAAEFSGELWGWGIYGEGGYVVVDAPDDVGTLDEAAADHERLVVGIDHTFDMQLYCILEYLRFGQGRTDSSHITLNDRLAYLTGEILSANRDTLYAGVSYPLTDLIEVSMYSLIGCNDPSAIFNPWLIYDLRPGLKLSVSVMLPVGDDESQHGKSGPSGFARLKWYF